MSDQTTLTKEEKTTLLKGLQDCSTALSSVEASKDVIKTIKNDLATGLKIDRKILAKLIKAFHEGNGDEERVLFQAFDDLYTAVTE